MSSADEKTKKKPVEKKTRRRIKKRWIMTTLIVFAVILFLLDLYCETFGLPGFARDYVVNEIRARGIDLRVERIRCGLLKGVILNGVEIKDGKISDFTVLSAESIRAYFSRNSLLQGELFLKKCTITNGSLSIPFFPEAGLEGKNDAIRLYDFNAHLKREGKALVIEDGQGTVEKLKVRFSGKIEKLFAYEAPLPSASESSTSDGEFESTSTYIKQIPYEARRKIKIVLDDIIEEKFKSSPECSFTFDLDAVDYLKNTLEGKFKIPGFDYGELKVKGVEGAFSLKGELISLERVKVSLGEDEFFSIKGAFDFSKAKLSGAVSGKTVSEKLLLFLNEKHKQTLAKLANTEKTSINFKGNLENYSIYTGKYQGKLDVGFDRLEITSLKLRNISAELAISDAGIEGRAVKAELVNGGAVYGSFNISEKEITGLFEGEALLYDLLHFADRQTLDLLNKNMSADPKTKIKFSASVKADSFRGKGISGNADISIPSVIEVQGIKFKQLKTKLSFTENYLKAGNANVLLADNTKITGDVEYFFQDKVMSASVSCSGPPGGTCKLLKKTGDKNFIDILNSFSWPEKDSMLESEIDIHYDLSENQFFFLNGNVVIKNFKYNGIFFNYGAARFLIDSNGLNVLPGIMLEDQFGQAFLRLVYDGRKNSTWAVKCPKIEYSKKPRNYMMFTVESTIKGNSFLKLIFSDWKSGFFSFPKSVHVKSRGLINYKDQAKTSIYSKIINGKCQLNKLPASDLDCEIFFDKHVLTVKDAKADICGGHWKTDYSYDYKNKKGALEVAFKDSRLKDLMKRLDWKGHEGGKDGLISAKMVSDINFDEKGKLLMNGDGNLSIKNADLWSIPFFGGLLELMGSAWSLNNFGKISTIDCTFKLKEDHLYSEDIHSNGSIVALEGKGEYYWNTHSFEFFIQAKLLKDALPFNVASFLLSPVSWLFEARVYRDEKSEKVQWEKISSLKRLFN